MSNLVKETTKLSDSINKKRDKFDACSSMEFFINKTAEGDLLFYIVLYR
ncbi:hypothetical protein J2Z82_000800 [Virgibacillus litoralis]|uniref:Uncharacterized protein n=1 Tax=Virgibacillus litoralis TaxID=578221 RepID=A0ABS4HAD8_9BACI|nr:hypothetical protein [Virgibacillus litoralis]